MRRLGMGQCVSDLILMPEEMEQDGALKGRWSVNKMSAPEVGTRLNETVAEAVSSCLACMRIISQNRQRSIKHEAAKYRGGLAVASTSSHTAALPFHSLGIARPQSPNAPGLLLV